MRRALWAGVAAGGGTVILGLYLSPHLLAAGYRIVRDRPAPDGLLERFAELMGGPGNVVLLGVLAALVWGMVGRHAGRGRVVGGLVCGLTAAWVVLATIQARWPDVLPWEFVWYQVSGLAGGAAGGWLARGLSGLLRAETEAVRRAQRAAADARDADGVAQALASELGTKQIVGVYLCLDPDEGPAGSWREPGYEIGGTELLSLRPPDEGFDEDGAAVARVRGIEGVRFALFVRLGESRSSPGLLVAGFRGLLAPGRRRRRRFVLTTPVAALALTVGRRERRLAGMEEQRRLARRMHDGQKQDLLCLPRHIRLAEQRLAEGDFEAVRESLGFASEGALRAVAETSALVREFRYAAGSPDPLPERLARLASRVAKEEGFAVEALVRGAPRRLKASVEEELFWVAREALSNAARHSRARRCGLRLVFTDTAVALEVRDNGVGFDPGKSRSAVGYGLASMRERAGEIGGAVLIESTPGSGTCVLASVPAPDESRKERQL